MNRFAIAKPKSFDEASSLAVDDRFELPVLKAGGMDIVDHLKEGLMSPDVLIDIREVASSPRINENIRRNGDRIIIEARATLAEIAESKIINETAPVIAQACESAATPQVRNVASAAGNLLQRPRCWYYRNQQFDCLKKGGHTCYAVEGQNRFHAILGGGPCHIVHPSNLAPALIVCNGEVHLTGGDRKKVAVKDLYHLPEKGVTSEHNLEPGEVITHLSFTPRPTSGFYAVKEKQSFDWPSAFACVAYDDNGGAIGNARVCAGAVAPIPWTLSSTEQALNGSHVDDEAELSKACSSAADGAKAMSQNAYKLQLLPVVVRRAVMKAAGRSLPDEMNGEVKS